MVNKNDSRKNEVEQIQLIIKEMRYINDGLINYADINSNYLLSIYSLIDVLETVMKNENINNKEVKIVNEIYNLCEKYKVIRNPKIYEKNNNPFKNMELPIEVYNYIEELEGILQEVVEK